MTESSRFAAGLVLGASGGIGAEITRRLAPHTNVVHAASRGGHLPAVSSEATLLAHRADATDYASVETLLRSTGPLDWLVTCVGAGRYAPLEADYSAAWAMVVGTNILALANVLAATRARQPSLGTLLVVLSLAAHQPSTTSGNTMYSAAKTAARTLLEQHRGEGAATGHPTRLCAVSPGYVRGTQFADRFFEHAPSHATDLFRGHPSMTAQDVAAAVEFALLAPPEVEISEVIIRPLRIDSAQ